MKTTITFLSIILCFCLSTTQLLAQSNTYFIAIDFVGDQCFGGGNPGCPNEALGLNHELLTSPAIRTYSFDDPLVGNDDIQDITITFFGDCSTIAEFSINDHVIGTETLISGCECFCGGDNNYISVSDQFSNGIPGYIYGGTNILKINHTNLAPRGQIRAFYAEIDINNNPPLSTNAKQLSESHFKIDKNPVKDFLKITSSLSGTSITLTDITGKKVLNQVLKERSTSINVSHLPSGLYFLKANHGSKTLTKKILKI